MTRTSRAKPDAVRGWSALVRLAEVAEISALRSAARGEANSRRAGSIRWGFSRDALAEISQGQMGLILRRIIQKYLELLADRLADLLANSARPMGKASSEALTCKGLRPADSIAEYGKVPEYTEDDRRSFIRVRESTSRFVLSGVKSTLRFGH